MEIIKPRPLVGGEALLLVPHSLFQGLVDEVLDVGADVHVGQLVGGGCGVDAVGEEDVDQVVLWVDPDHGAGEAGVAEAALAGGRGDMGAAAGDERFVEAEGTAVALVGEMATIEGVEGLGGDILASLVATGVEHHLVEFGEVVGSGEETGMA